ncbi:MAG: hypothetical protein IJ829_05880 [Kiritimatiellae bacterium]|nr:hypothetical protein [Kiritimatiellia bacterium]
MECVVSAAAFVALASGANAATYYWKSGSTLGDYGTLSNWSTESTTGADATALPGSGDKLDYAGDYAFDLGGNTYEIGGWSASGDSGARRTVLITNGALDNKGDWKPYKMTMTIGSGGTFVHSAGSFLPGQDSTAITYVNVENGGTFVLTGACNPMNLYFNVAAGGTFDFTPSYWGLPNKACASGIQFNNSGTLNMTSGMTISNGAASGGAITVTQSAGTFNLAGTFNGASQGSRSSVSLSFRFVGGTVNVTGSAAFVNCAAVTLAGATTWNVSTGATLDLSGMTFGFDSTAFGPGDTIITTDDSALRAKVLSDLTALGLSVEESGDDVRLAAAGPRTTPMTFYWVNNDANSWQGWNDAASWTDANGNAVTETPTAIDTVASFNATTMRAYIDLGGAGVTNEIAALSVVHSAWWKYDQFALTNGALVVHGTANFESPTPFNIWKDATLCVSNLTFSNKSTGEDNMDNFVVHDGGRLEILGDFQPRQMNITVEAGGYYLYAASAVLQNCNYGRFHNVVNSGSMDWPGGLWQHNNVWSVNPYVRQLDGEWTLGDRMELPNNLYGRVELTGGTLKATGNVSFRLYGSSASADNAWAKFMPHADVTLDVAEGKTLDMVRSDSRYVPFTYEPDADGTNYAKITRTGLGTLLLADVPYSLDLQDGTTTFSANTRTAMGTLKVGAGQSFIFANADTALATLEDNAGTITIAQPGLSIGALGAGATLAGSFEIATAAFVVGDVVVTTPDATLRAAIKSAAEAAFESAGMSIVESGDALSVGASSYVFDSTTVTDLDDPAGWQSGLPPQHKDVTVSGAGVNAIVSVDLTNVWNSITVQDGAALSVAAAGLTLPSLVFRGASSLAVGADCTLGSLTTIADDAASPVAVPTLVVASGATLTVPAGYRFSNVRLVLCDGATLREDGDGSLVFGYAAAGETAYFEMYATNATIGVTNSLAPHNAPSPYNGLARIDFAAPASGGRVVVPEPIFLKGVAFERGYATEGHYVCDGFAFGLNNPEDEEVKIVIDDSFVIFGEHSWIAGGVNLVLTNNAVLCRSIFPNAATKTGSSGSAEGDKTINWYNLHINDLAKLTLVDGGELRAGVGRVNNDVVSGLVNLNPSAAGHVGIEVLEGGVADWYKTNGSKHKTVYDNTYASEVSQTHKGTVAFSGGVMEVFKDNWYGNGGNRAHILNGLAAVDVAEGKTLLFRGVADRMVTEFKSLGLVEVESPLSGAGDVAVTNTWNGKNLTMVFSCGANTCTGTLEARDCEGTATAAIWFTDGANWAGTVVANGNVKLVDPIGSSEWNGAGAYEDAPVAVTFAALDLRADWPVRVWADETGAYSCDTLAVGLYRGNGRLVPTLMTEGAAFAPRDSLVVGTIAKSSPSPAVANGWAVKRLALADDDTRETLVLKRGVGLQVILR